MIEDIQEKTHELKVEMIKLQVNSAEKQIVTDALTKVAVIETDVSQVRGEVKSIMTHLLNKPRMSGINRNNL
jgi:ribosomal protein S8E